jgi:serine/threonine protein kinase
MTSDAKEGKTSGGAGTMVRIYNVADHYEILDKVGRGTYGSVYKAKGLKDGRWYAIKKL